MFDSVSWFISLISTVVGMAGAFIVAMLIFALILIAKLMPSGLRKTISAAATTFVIFTLLTELTSQNFYLIIYKSIFNFDFFSAIVLTLVFSIYVILVVQTVLRQNKSEVCEAISVNEQDEKYVANKKKLSSPSSFLKVSSVMLQ